MRHVLVFQLARFGDIIQTKRLLLSIKAEPGTRLHLCVDHSLAALAGLVYPFAHIHALPAHAAGDAGDAARAVAAWHTLAELRAMDFDEVYCLNFSPLSFACAALFPPERLRGYARVRGQEMRGPLSHIAFNLMRDRRLSPLNLADLWACLHPDPIAPENVNPIAGSAAGNRIGVVMAGREARRSLPVRELAQCLEALFLARGGPEIVCLGSAAERPLVRRLARLLPPPMVRKLVDESGRTQLTDLPDILGSLDLLLTPDTGLMHLAAHLGVPVRAFFLSSAWCWETGPYGLGHTVWQALDSCSPCIETAPCPHNVQCLHPFSNPAFLNHLRGSFDPDWPETLLGCVTGFDSFGVTCAIVDGHDPWHQARQELRTGLFAWLGQIPSGASMPVMPVMGEESAALLFTERDWMLPDNWRCKC